MLDSWKNQLLDNARRALAREMALAYKPHTVINVALTVADPSLALESQATIDAYLADVGRVRSDFETLKAAILAVDSGTEDEIQAGVSAAYGDFFQTHRPFMD